MPVSIVDIPVMFAQAKAPAPGPAGGGAAANQGGLTSFLPFLLIIAVWFYMLIIRPQQKQDRARKEMMANLKKNDRVLTSAGIFGTVMSVDPEQDRVVLRIDDDRGVKVTFSRASVVRIFDTSDDKSKDKTSKEKAAETV
jgi:preprotein translocase subunit YajC